MNSQWKLVPVEPTETMVINGFESVPNECFTDDEVWEQYQEMSGCQQAAFRAKLCWAAMIAAAPNPATEEVKSGGEPKPYPDRLCHIDYTAHPHRCGCLSGDGEAQRRFDEYQRDTKLAKAEGDVARLTAERDALQQRLNAADQRIDDLISTFQVRVQPWLMECFGPMIAGDREERNHRFIEEALELVQACGCSATEAHKLVDYVYGRDVGEPAQEVGGVMVTLAALCLANGLDMHESGETELARIWTKIEQIRAKQAAKPQMSPLPGAYPQRTPQ